MSTNVKHFPLNSQTVYEKLTAEIDLPSKGLVWPSLKEKLQAHKELNGGSIYSSLRLAARFGVDRILQNCGLNPCDDMRIDEPAVGRELHAATLRVISERRAHGYITTYEDAQEILTEGGLLFLQAVGFCSQDEIREMAKRTER